MGASHLNYPYWTDQCFYQKKPVLREHLACRAGTDFFVEGEGERRGGGGGVSDLYV